MCSVGEPRMRAGVRWRAQVYRKMSLGKRRFCYMVESKFQDIVEAYISSIYKKKTR